MANISIVSQIATVAESQVSFFSVDKVYYYLSQVYIKFFYSNPEKVRTNIKWTSPSQNPAMKILKAKSDLCQKNVYIRSCVDD